jgi:hypothetical protein
MARKPAVKGTTQQERRDLRERRREANRINYATARAAEAKKAEDDCRRLVVVVCNAALALAKRLNQDGRKRLVEGIGVAMDAANRPEFRRDAA